MHAFPAPAMSYDSQDGYTSRLNIYQSCFNPYRNKNGPERLHERLPDANGDVRAGAALHHVGQPGEVLLRQRVRGVALGVHLWKGGGCMLRCGPPRVARPFFYPSILPTKAKKLPTRTRLSLNMMARAEGSGRGMYTRFSKRRRMAW